MKVFISGNLVDEKEAMISVFDHGLLYDIRGELLAVGNRE